MDLISSMYRAIEDLKRVVSLLRRGLVRMGKVHSVDASAGTIVIEYSEEDATGQPLRSYPMPFLQRSHEHRPPVVNDHVLVLDPSLGNGGAIAFPGWPSTARPPVEGGGNGNVVYSGPETALIKSGSTQFWVTSSGIRIGADDASEAIPLGTTQKQKLDQILNYLKALHNILNGPPIAEPGMGAPSALQTSLKAAVIATPLPTDLSGTISTKHKIKD